MELWTGGWNAGTRVEGVFFFGYHLPKDLSSRFFHISHASGHIIPLPIISKRKRRRLDLPYDLLWVGLYDGTIRMTGETGHGSGRML